ncbi:MAG: DHH family phosphoesterase [Oscillospiraceae bacterium]|nr:DHH family phosphoesterase [Oscillospiraceae bacterium]
MNKKLAHLLEPSMALYFTVVFLMAGMAFVLEQYYLAAAEVAVLVVLFFYFRYTSARRKKAILKYIQNTAGAVDEVSSSALDMPLPSAVVNITSGEIVWANHPFSQLTGSRDTVFSQKISDLFPQFDLRWLAEGKPEAPDELVYQKRRFRVMGNLARGTAGGPVLLGSVYLLDLTELLRTHDEYQASRPIVSIILIDNYDELTTNLSENNISTMNAAIDVKINEWAAGRGGLLRKVERNRYFFVFESRYLQGMIDAKFSLLESIRLVTNPAGISATISLGIGKDGVSFQESYDFAALSIETALARGGDQAVIKDRYNFTFYGGRSKETERQTKVRSRVVANSLSELAGKSSSIFIMGHKNADIDAMGAAAGVQCICRKLGKRAWIVVDRQHNAAGTLLSKLEKLPEYAGCYISGQEALLRADSSSLLIVVDTNRPDQVEAPELLESIRQIAVVDHHRRAADYIQNVVLNLHEPFASSASELVAELLEYAVEPQDILPLESEALLAGIVLDTKNFGVRTGGRTFEAAAFLRRTGADTVDVKKLFQNNLDDTLAKYKIIQAARLYRGNIAISALDYTSTRTLASQAADELLNISGILTSFVLYPDGERVIISARSIGDANVQMILESLGGGGNAATAGAQVQGKAARDVLVELVTSIDKFYEN